MSADAMDCVYDGQGRPRKKKAEKTDLPSHYQYAYWAYEDGKRYAVPVGGVCKDKRAEFPLISTTIMNEGTGTETLIWLHFDLDFKRADKRWIRNGKLDWPTMAATLSEDAPIILKYLSHVVRSSGGHGLSLVLAISPLELIDETADVQKLAFKVQSMIIHILNHHDMGADEGARGLKRLMPNVFRQEQVLDQAEFVMAMIQKRRPRVIQNLIYALRFHSALREKNKRDRDDILWPDIRVEKPLARIYTDILDEAGPWGSIQLTAGEITKRYGISKNTVYKLLSEPPKWLVIEPLASEGYRLTIHPVRELTDRAWEILQEKPDKAGLTIAHIARPESLQKGERNHWLVSLVLSCKWKGFGQRVVHAALDRIIKHVPGWQKSQSLTRDLGSIVRSLFHHRSSLRGGMPELVLPGWLLEVLQSVTPKRSSQTFYKKGSPKGGSRALLPEAKPEDDLEVVPIEPFSSSVSGGIMPGVSGGQSPVVTRSVRNPLELSDKQISGEFSYQLMGDALPGELKIVILNSLAGMSHEQALAVQREYLNAVYLKSIGVELHAESRADQNPEPLADTVIADKPLVSNIDPRTDQTRKLGERLGRLLDLDAGSNQQPETGTVESVAPLSETRRKLAEGLGHLLGLESEDSPPIRRSTSNVTSFDHLTGSALSSAFSKALMKSPLSAAEKARILTEVTSITDPAIKDRVRREWLVKL